MRPPQNDGLASWQKESQDASVLEEQDKRNSFTWSEWFQESV